MQEFTFQTSSDDEAEKIRLFGKELKETDVFEEPMVAYNSKWYLESKEFMDSLEESLAQAHRGEGRPIEELFELWDKEDME